MERLKLSNFKTVESVMQNDKNRGTKIAIKPKRKTYSF